MASTGQTSRGKKNRVRPSDEGKQGRGGKYTQEFMEACEISGQGKKGLGSAEPKPTEVITQKVK